MGYNSVAEFTKRREAQNELLHQYAGRDTKRFLSLDHQAYLDGALPAKSKELLGLVASLVLRCDDCVTYHLTKCHACECSTDEVLETLHIGLIAGGSIVIPHLRRAIVAWDELVTQAPAPEATP